MTLILNGTTGEVFPTWTTAGRPSSPSTGQTGFNTTTGQMETYNGSAWVISPSATTQGSSGQYLQSNGAGTAPSWATFSTSTGNLIRAPQILISGTSYTTPATCTSIYVELWGAGGGGGGARMNSGSGAGTAIGGAGGGGAYLSKYLSVSSLTAYTIAVGAGGTAGSGPATTTAGGTGGTTSIIVSGTTYSATGGTGGGPALVTSNTTSTGTAGTGGTATNGDLNVSALAGSYFVQGVGGTSQMFIGLGGVTPSSNGAGGAAPYYTGGGGGGYFNGSNGNNSGGVGYQGLIRIWEYT
jgi:hypothetical protein